MGLEAGPVMPLDGEALAACEAHDGQAAACVQGIKPWSPPFPFPEEEGVCMDMTTKPPISKKRTVVYDHDHHRRSLLSEEEEEGSGCLAMDTSIRPRRARSVHGYDHYHHDAPSRRKWTVNAHDHHFPFHY